MEEAKKKLTDWTTREELLLACAVERYGKGDWKTVAMEIQARTSLPVILLSAEACESKFHDLKRRFMDDGDDDAEQDGAAITWLEELRKLRVLELKEEVHQSDLSIQRLQLKVKRLEDERDTCLKMSGDHDVNLDLTQRCPDETESPKASSAVAAVAAAAADHGLDRNHLHSVNESNSSDYIDDSSVTIGQHAEKKRRSSQDEKRVNSAELSNQTAELKMGKTASKKKRALDKDHPNREPKLLSTTVSPATSDVKPEIRSQPLVELLDVIRSHKQIRMLERRPEIQIPAVRQHVDLESIRSRIDDGSYSSDVNKFYRDLLLFVTNAIVSYPKTSSESAASHKIRDLVLNHLKDNKPTVVKPPLPVAAAVKHEQESSSAPVLVVCRRRTSGAAKPNKSSPVVTNDETEKTEITGSIETNDGKRKSATPAPGTKKAKNQQVKIVSGVKSLRRGVTTRVENSPENKKRPGNDDRKKKGVVEFLKRIVSKSPPEKSKVRKIEEKKKSGSRGGDKVDGGKKGKNSPERIVSGKRKRGAKEEVPLRITKKSTKK